MHLPPILMGLHAYVHRDKSTHTYTDPPISDVVQAEIDFSNQNLNMSYLIVKCAISLNFDSIQIYIIINFMNIKVNER